MTSDLDNGRASTSGSYLGQVWKATDQSSRSNDDNIPYSAARYGVMNFWSSSSLRQTIGATSSEGFL